MKLKVRQVLLTFMLCVMVLGQPLPSYGIERVSISSATLNNQSAPLTGSLMGGTTLNLQGLGFDSQPSNNRIWVGQSPCIPTGPPTQTGISCQTTPAVSANITNLTIMISAPGKPNVTCVTPQCQFSYTADQTPFLRAVYPRAGVINDTVKFYGIHRIANLSDGRTGGDVRALLIGNSVCGRADIKQGPIDPTNFTYISCRVPPTIEAGYYNVSELLTLGYANKSQHLMYGSLTNNPQIYEFQVIPTITGLSSRSGPPFGQTLNITGTGFTSNLSRLSISAGGSQCKVLSANTTSITCLVQPVSLTNNTFGRISNSSQFLSGSGVQYVRYDINPLPFKTINGLRDAVVANSTRITVLERGVRSELQSPDIYGTNYGQVMRGYFLAPVAGNYTFRAIVDDQLFFYMSGSVGSTDVNYSSPLMSSNTSSNNAWDMDYNFQSTPLVSSPITLSANQIRYFQVWHINTIGSGNFSVAVQLPNPNPTHPSPNTRLAGSPSTLFYESVPAELLFTSTTSPQLTIRVNNITAQCRTNCTYNISNMTANPLLANLTYNATAGLMQLNITNPANVTFDISRDVTVLIDGSRCENVQGNQSQYVNCTPRKNWDGTLQMRTGTVNVTVEIRGYGVLNVTASFVPFVFNLTTPTLTYQISDQNASLSGGALVDLRGLGFPLNLTDSSMSSLSVFMCNSPAAIESVNNTHLIIRAPLCSPNTTNNNSAGTSTCISSCYSRHSANTVNANNCMNECITKYLMKGMKIPTSTLLGVETKPEAPVMPTPVSNVSNATVLPVNTVNFSELPVANATGQCLSVCISTFFNRCQKMRDTDIITCLQNCVNQLQTTLKPNNLTARASNFQNSTYTVTTTCLFSCTDCSTTHLNSTSQCISNCLSNFLKNLFLNTSTSVTNTTTENTTQSNTSHCLANCSAGYFILAGYSNVNVNMSGECFSGCISEYVTLALVRNNVTRVGGCYAQCVRGMLGNCSNASGNTTAQCLAQCGNVSLEAYGSESVENQTANCVLNCSNYTNTNVTSSLEGACIAGCLVNYLSKLQINITINITNTTNQSSTTGMNDTVSCLCPCFQNLTINGSGNSSSGLLNLTCVSNCTTPLLANTTNTTSNYTIPPNITTQFVLNIISRCLSTCMHNLLFNCSVVTNNMTSTCMALCLNLTTESYLDSSPENVTAGCLTTCATCGVGNHTTGMDAGRCLATCLTTYMANKINSTFVVANQFNVNSTPAMNQTGNCLQGLLTGIKTNGAADPLTSIGFLNRLSVEQCIYAFFSNTVVIPTTVIAPITPTTPLPITNQTSKCFSTCISTLLNGCASTDATAVTTCLQTCINAYKNSLVRQNQTAAAGGYDNATTSTAGTCIKTCTTTCADVGTNATGQCVANCLGTFVDHLINNTGTGVANTLAATVSVETGNMAGCVFGCTSWFFGTVNYAVAAVNANTTTCMGGCLSEYILRVAKNRAVSDKATCLTGCTNTLIYSCGTSTTVNTTAGCLANCTHLNDPSYAANTPHNQTASCIQNCMSCSNNATNLTHSQCLASCLTTFLANHQLNGAVNISNSIGAIGTPSMNNTFSCLQPCLINLLTNSTAVAGSAGAMNTTCVIGCVSGFISGNSFLPMLSSEFGGCLADCSTKFLENFTTVCGAATVVNCSLDQGPAGNVTVCFAKCMARFSNLELHNLTLEMNNTANATGMELGLCTANFTTAAPISGGLNTVSNCLGKALSALAASLVFEPTKINITMSGQSVSLDYIYNRTIKAPNITSIWPVSGSSVVKGNLSINGSGFGWSISNLSAWMVNSAGRRAYQLNILSASDNLLVVRYPPATSGVYRVVVNRTQYGDSVETTPNSSRFIYEVTVTNVYPSFGGSMNGGTPLVITGRGFPSNVNQVKVAIGNSWCPIQTINSTRITCTTPLLPPHLPFTQPITLITPTTNSTCESSCTFTYDRDYTPTLTFFNNNTILLIPQMNYTLNGTNFIMGALNPTVMLGNHIVNVVEANATQLTFTCPQVPAGMYPLGVVVEGVGYASPITVAQVELNVTGLSMSRGSTGGNVVTLRGQGIVPLNDWDYSLSVTLRGNPVPYQLISALPSGITVRLPQSSDNDMFIFIYTYKNNAWTFNYTTLTSSSPRADLVSPSSIPYNPSTSILTLNRSALSYAIPNLVTAIPVSSTGTRLGPDIPLPVTTVYQVNSTFLVNATDLRSGKYNISCFYNNFGFGMGAPSLEVLASTYGAAVVNASYRGGLYKINGTGLNGYSTLMVGNVKAELVSNTSTLLVYRYPPLVSAVIQSTYKIAQPVNIRGTPFADNTAAASLAFDGQRATVYTSSLHSCWVGLDAGVGNTVNITKVRWLPNRSWLQVSPKLAGSEIQGSNDDSSYTTLFALDNTARMGWNSWRPSTPLSTNYRYIRFLHTSASKCQLSQFQVYGLLFNSGASSLSSNPIPLTFTDGHHNSSWPSHLTYTQASTPNISSITPPYGSPNGGYNITLTGTNFPVRWSMSSVVIDGVPCAVVDGSATQLVCTVGRRGQLPERNTFEVMMSDNVAHLNCENFTYVSRYSDPETWQGDLLPRPGQDLYVPKGMILLIDNTTANLGKVNIDGGLVFSDQTNLTFQCSGINLNPGSFMVAGSPASPYRNNLTILLHGARGSWSSSKAITCNNCRIDLTGTARKVQWTELTATAEINATSITVKDDVSDWRVGDEIVIASTSFEHTEAERRVVTAVGAGLVHFAGQPLQFRHSAANQTFGSAPNQRIVPIRGQVIHLTRSIRITGDNDTTLTRFGTTISLVGSSQSGLTARLAYLQLSLCGQPSPNAVLSRSCFHFCNNPDASNSFLVGNSIRDSYSRIAELKSVSYLNIYNNVGFRISGSAFLLVDGTEVKNVIEGNVVVSTLQSWEMMQGDLTPAAFWIGNPVNTVRRNRAAGGDYYGFNYEFRERPDGPAAITDFALQNLPVDEVRDNVAHSNRRIGVRINKLVSNERIFNPIKNYTLVLDEFGVGNPSIKNTFSGEIIYRNQQIGLLAEQLGNTLFTNMAIADSGVAGLQIHTSNFSKQGVTISNTIFIGQSPSSSNPSPLSSTGLITPRTSGLNCSNISFWNYPASTTAIQMCSDCQNLTSSQRPFTHYFNTSTLNNITGNYLTWSGPRQNMIFDTDGSLTNSVFANDGVSRVNVTVLPWMGHNAIECANATVQGQWNGSMVCSGNHVRIVTFKNLSVNTTANVHDQSAFVNQSINFYRLVGDPNQLVLNTNDGLGDIFKMNQPAPERDADWLGYFVPGATYRVWWGHGIDLNHLTILPSFQQGPTEPGIILAFNNTQFRQFYDLRVGFTLNNSVTLLTQSYTQLDPSNCSFGDYYFQVGNKTLYVCVSGRRTRRDVYLDVNSTKCRFMCEVNKEQFVRRWSNVTQWPGAVLPAAGDNVTVPAEWTILLDVDPPVLGSLILDGNLFLMERDTKIQTDFFWIRLGTFHVGNSTRPWNYKLNITITGQTTSPNWTVGSNPTANKYMVVTGNLTLNGRAPSTTWTRLTSKATQGQTTITVADTSDWSIGDQIVIAPSFSPNHTQKLTITGITGTTVTFTPALMFTHYGDATPTVNSQYGALDMRAGVGHLTRSITIQRGQDTTGHGFRLLVTSFTDGARTRSGTVYMKGVQIVEGGQVATENAALHVNGLVGTTGYGVWLEGCTFHDNFGIGTRIANSNNVTILNSVYYIARKHIVSVASSTSLTFQNNLLIGAVDRINATTSLPAGQDVACFSQNTPYVAANVIQNNLCQGSELHGFVIPYMACSAMTGLAATNKFSENTVGTARIGYLVVIGTEHPNPGMCVGAELLKAYGCEVGVSGLPSNTTSIIYQNMVLADNVRAIGLRTSNNNSNLTNLGYLKNSWISAAARTTCNYCYPGPSNLTCINSTGMRLMTSSNDTKTYPDSRGFSHDDEYNNSLSYQARAYLTNVTFDNFRITYSGNFANCSNSKVFAPHPNSIDRVSLTFIRGGACTQCELPHAAVNFTQLNESYYGTNLTVCGVTKCTGLLNYFITDEDGGFLGVNGSLLAPAFINGTEPGCTYSATMLGYSCTSNSYSILYCESNADDKNNRTIWPVNLTYYGGNWTSQTSAQRQLQFNNSIPMNRRTSRFLSLVRLGRSYNLSFTGRPPSDMTFRLQNRSLSNTSSDWVSVWIWFPVSSSISVLVNQTAKVDPILSNSVEDVSNRSNVCGANKYFKSNNTIAFVVNSRNCEVRIRVSSSLGVVTTLATNLKDFEANGGVNKFIEKMSSFLLADKPKGWILRVISVKQGSTIVEFQVVPPAGTTQEATQLTDLSNKIVGATPGSIDLGQLGPVSSSSSVVSVVSPDGTTTSTVVIPATPSTTTPVDNTKDIIIIAVAVSVGSFLIILLVSYLVIRKIRNRQPIEPDAPELSNIGIALKPKEQAREEFDFQDRNNEYKPALPR